MKKRILTVLLVGLMALSLTGCKQTANEPCQRCSDSPSVVYNFDNGTTAYVCEDCSSKCDFCGGNPDNIYMNGFGMVMFACNDCYSSISQY